MIEIVAIGDELLAGHGVNSNATVISAALFDAGFCVSQHHVFSDQEKALHDALKVALERASCIITTGGLGPTCDDHTRKVIAKLFGDRLEKRPELVEKLKSYFGEHATLEDQATVPTQARLLDNPAGTASGLVMDNGKQLLIAMPGVPKEMVPMLHNHVIPYLKKELKGEKKEKERLFFCHITESEVDPIIRQLQKKYPQVAFGIYPAHGTLAVHMTGNHHEAKRELLEKFGSYAYDAPNGDIDEAVHQLMVDKELTLSVAESCTGGALAATITRHPGSSKYFLGGVVAYSNALKKNLLQVKNVDQWGAVSKETVTEMVLGILEQTGSDWALAVSGIAGPDGGTDDKPVGTVWYALCHRGRDPSIWQKHLRGTREVIITHSVNLLLSELYLKVKYG
ncbi:MAG: CinA family nicotinamide mononucleotide deamidase-related protein [Chlamydiia bacterium]|nr:CinA family nicotinamide mononucleotide deamidase-related protein [Chlamydiia bacterium]